MKVLKVIHNFLFIVVKDEFKLFLETLELLKKNFGNPFFSPMTDGIGQSIMITDVKKDVIIENCIKFLINKRFNKLVYNQVLDDGIQFRFERMFGFAHYFEVGIYQEGNDVKLIMWFSIQSFPKPRQNSIYLYLDLVKSIYRRLKRKVPISTVEKLSTRNK
jgi:hypothetical protein